MSAVRPIGYWLKLLDQLIERDLDRSLTQFGLSRRHWQLLNVADENPRRSSEFAAALAPFVESPSDVDALLRELTEAGWLQSSAGEVGLTPSGSERLAAARATVVASRRRISEGLSREAYETTTSTLEAMCRNLGWTDVE